VKWLIAAAVGLGVLYLARAALPPFIIAAVLAYIFSPVVDEAESRARIPRWAAVAGLYVLLLGGLGLGVWFLETQLVREVRALSNASPGLVDAAFIRLLGGDRFAVLGQEVDAHTLAEWTSDRLAETVAAPTDALRVAEWAIDITLKTVLTIVALFYLLLDGQRLVPYVLRLVPAERRGKVEEVMRHVHVLLGRYLRGQLFLIALMSAATYLVLTFVFRLPFALPIAIATGVLEVIPLFGPVAAAAIASVVALAHGGVGTMVGVIVAYIVLRQVEDQLVMPVVVGRILHLHPLVTIFAVLVGATMAGVLGAILAVPAAAALRVVLEFTVVGPSASAAVGPGQADQMAGAMQGEREEPRTLNEKG
jgi:predicted PurR-regulated permease PerM